MKVKLAIWRIRRGMTQEQLAEASGLHKQTIFRIENKGVIPHPDTLTKIAKALNVSTEELLVEENDERLARVS